MTRLCWTKLCLFMCQSRGQRSTCSPPCQNWPSLGQYLHQASVSRRLTCTADTPVFPHLSVEDIQNKGGSGQDGLDSWMTKRTKWEREKNQTGLLDLITLETQMLFAIIFCCMRKSAKPASCGKLFCLSPHLQYNGRALTTVMHSYYM